MVQGRDQDARGEEGDTGRARHGPGHAVPRGRGPVPRGRSGLLLRTHSEARPGPPRVRAHRGVPGGRGGPYWGGRMEGDVVSGRPQAHQGCGEGWDAVGALSPMIWIR